MFPGPELSGKISTRLGMLICLLIISYFPLFHNLGKFQIRMWDEATYANNAIDMFQGGNLLVVEHLGKPDDYNTKPPFVIWWQALFMKLIGVNELAVRLPSAIFTLGTILLVFTFCCVTIGSASTGFVASLILLSSKGYICNHVARTGDLDAILVFWLTLCIFSFIDLITRKPANPSGHMVLIGLAVLFGFLTKGIAGFFFVPVMFLLMFVFRKYELLKLRQSYQIAIAVLLVCLGYYTAREYMNPGYVALVWNSEFARMGSEVMSWHVHPFGFYYHNLANDHFHPYIFILPFTLLSLFVLKQHEFRIFLSLFIAALVYFLLISFPPVKLEWYDAPLIPILSVIIAITIIRGAGAIISLLPVRTSAKRIEIALKVCSVLMVIKPYLSILEMNAWPEKQVYEMELEGAYLKHLQVNNPEISTITILKKEKDSELYDQVLFYKRAYELENKMRVRLTMEPILRNDELVMACKQEDQQLIEKSFLFDRAHSWNHAVVYRIKGKK